MTDIAKDREELIELRTEFRMLCRNVEEMNQETREFRKDMGNRMNSIERRVEGGTFTVKILMGLITFIATVSGAIVGLVTIL